MSTSRYLNWSRPSPGRHHPLRKQISCFESFSGGGRSLSVNNLASAVSADKSVDFATFVTAATIHKNRFQNYHTYHQAHHRGTIISADTGTDGGSGSSTLISDGGPPRATPRRRPASAHTTSSSASSLSGLTMAKKVNTHESRKVLTKQLSLDHPGVLGPPAGHAWTTTASRTPTIGGTSSDHHSGAASPKVCPSSGIKKRPPGLSVKNDIESSEHIKKVLKQGKDSRINIKIFLGQTVQQDSSDTGHSDTECSPNQSQQQQQNHRNQPQQPSSQPPAPPQPSQQPLEQQGNQKAEAENSQPEGASKPKQQQSSSGSGRNSSLAQRRAQFQANRQNSETAERRPPLVRAMSAPIRPIDNDSKFLQSKKKTRKKKVLRERDEINECDEDDFDEETLKLNATNSKNTLAAAAAAGGAGPRSRSVLGGACDIETLVSLLSSGGSDSEKEDTVPTNGADPTGNSSTNFNINISSVLKSRAPMLKKAGKSVSFQETELKQTAGLNRDYYQPGHRKPPSLQPFANRIRRSQQLANTLNAFQKKSLTEETKSDEDKDQHSSDESKDNANSNVSIPPSSNPTKTLQPSSQSSSSSLSSSSSSDAKTEEAGNAGSAQDGGLVDGQTPKERECYRLFQKMSNMGLSVSYDTILRGMLTPTELRVLQKQRTKLQKQQESSSRQNSSETEKENDSSDNSKSEGSGASVSDLSSLLSSGPELEVVSGPLPVLAEQTVE